MKEGVLVFQVDKFQQLSIILGTLFVLGVGVPKVMSAFRIITGAYLRGRDLELVLFPFWGSRY